MQRWRALDPIDRYRTWLLAGAHADDAFVAECDASAEAEVTRIRADVIATEPPPAGSMFDWTYADPPSQFLRERTEALGDA